MASDTNHTVCPCMYIYALLLMQLIYFIYSLALPNYLLCLLCFIVY